MEVVTFIKRGTLMTLKTNNASTAMELVEKAVATSAFLYQSSSMFQPGLACEHYGTYLFKSLASKDLACKD